VIERVPDSVVPTRRLTRSHQVPDSVSERVPDSVVPTGRLTRYPPGPVPGALGARVWDTVVVTIEFRPRPLDVTFITGELRNVTRSAYFRHNEEIVVSVAWRSTLYVTNFREGMDDVQMLEMFSKVRSAASQSSFSDQFRFSVWYNARCSLPRPRYDQANQIYQKVLLATFNARLQLDFLLILILNLLKRVVTSRSTRPLGLTQLITPRSNPSARIDIPHPTRSLVDEPGLPDTSSALYPLASPPLSIPLDLINHS